MASKNTKSVGKIHGQSLDYWVNASKQIPWDVDIQNSHISVPFNEVELAVENLMVKHFVNNGFFIQQCIPNGVSKKVFNPEIRFKLPSEKITPVDSIYKTGDSFRVNSTMCEMEITSTESKKIHLRYTNRDKNDLIYSEELIHRNVSMKYWDKL